MKKNAGEITTLFLNKLWLRFMERVPYAKAYSDLAKSFGAQPMIDHIAFRTLNTHTGEQPEGIRAIKHILNYLDFKVADHYQFSKKNLKAVHFENPDPSFPKIFVSQLQVENLPAWAQELIHITVKDSKYLLSDKSIEILNQLRGNGNVPLEAAEYLTDDLVQYFRRPWNLPEKSDLLKLNDVSQYGAWVLLFGNAVNHFSVSVNYQGISQLPDIESTCKALAGFGIPMLDCIEGEKNGLLRQSATKAVKEEIRIKGASGYEKMDWPYGYLEFTQRGHTDKNGLGSLYSGFLSDQTSHLFEMTLTREN